MSSLSPSSCFPFQLLSAEQGDASSRPPHGPAKWGWEGSKGMKRVWDGAGGDPPATVEY